MAAQIRRQDVPVLAQRRGDPVPVAAVVAPAMHQQQRRRGRVAPIDVMEPQPLREIDPRGRAGARDIECRHGMPYAAALRNCRWRSDMITPALPNLPQALSRVQMLPRLLSAIGFAVLL